MGTIRGDTDIRRPGRAERGYVPIDRSEGVGDADIRGDLGHQRASRSKLGTTGESARAGGDFSDGYKFVPVTLELIGH
jgi:hypothetical protein